MVEVRERCDREVTLLRLYPGGGALLAPLSSALSHPRVNLLYVST